MTREIKLTARYPFDLLFWALMPLTWLLHFIFQGRALLGNELLSENFEKLTGSPNVLEFIFIGSLLWNIINSSIWGAGNALRMEQNYGTFQLIWIAPISHFTLLIGYSMAGTLWSLFQISIQFIVLSFFTIWQVTFVDVVMTFLILLLVLIGLYGCSFFFAAIIIVFKDPNTISESISDFLYCVSPIRYPMEVLPIWIRWFAFILPLSWGLTAIRFLLITNGEIIQMLYMVGILLIIDVVFWILGCFLFKIAEKKILRTGSVDTY